MKNETTTPHPLAVEAAKQCESFHHPTHHALIIHTTALEPVLEAGEDLAAVARNAECRCDWGEQECLRCSALTQWRTLTTPKTAPQSTLAGSRDVFQPHDRKK